jgi:predicted peptidase
MIVSASACFAGEELITTATMQNGEAVPYVLNANSASPHYVLILFPGASGIVNPYLQDGKLVYSMQTNFLLRARSYLVDEEFATVSTNATSEQVRVQALIDDLTRRYPAAKIYLMGTSKGTVDTMALADYLSDKIAGEIHTSSMARIAYFDASKYKNRHLIVHHGDDNCRNTPLTAAKSAHDRYGDELIVMQGGISEGDLCGPFAHHGYNGIETETVEVIKRWVKQGG